MIFLRFLLFFFLVFLFGILLEIICHPKFGLSDLVRQLCADIATAWNSIFKEDQIVPRHTFDMSLVNDLIDITNDFANRHFEVRIWNGLLQKVPSIVIQFVPKKQMDENELWELTQLLLLRFRRYLAVCGIVWDTFGIYKQFQHIVEIALFYSELPEDVAPYMKRYETAISEECGEDFGALHDKELEDEFREI